MHQRRTTMELDGIGRTDQPLRVAFERTADISFLTPDIDYVEPLTWRMTTGVVPSSDEPVYVVASGRRGGTGGRFRRMAPGLEAGAASAMVRVAR